MAEFKFKTQPYEHQEVCWSMSKEVREYALFPEMGCGKSKIILDTAGFLASTGKIDATVVVAPKSVYRNWAENEIPTHFTDSVEYRCAYWTSYERKDDKERMKKLLAPGSFHRFLLVNVEAINSKRVEDFLEEFLKKFRCLMVVDESTTIKNPDAKRTKKIIGLGKLAAYRRICTGNPMPNGPLDLYSQSEFLRPGILGFGSYYGFRNRFAVMVQQKLGPRSFNKVVGFRDLEDLKRLMRRFSFIIKKQDCLDLPPKIYQTVDVEMGEQQKLAYDKMLNDAFIALGDDAQVTAQLVLTQLVRLHQIACGFLKPDGLPEVSFTEPNNRLEVLLDVLEQAPGKVIIWANYRHNIKQIMVAVREKFGHDSVAHFYGETTEDERQKAKENFQNPESPVRFMLASADAGKWGNTWTQGTTVVYYSNSYNLESREQSEDRAHRIGQVGAIHAGQGDPSVLYVDLVSRGTVDERVLKILKNKKKLSDAIITSNWRWLLGLDQAA